MTISELEKAAGITNRTAFWMQFAHIKGTIRVNGIERVKALETGIKQLRQMAWQRSRVQP